MIKCTPPFSPSRLIGILIVDIPEYNFRNMEKHTVFSGLMIMLLLLSVQGCEEAKKGENGRIVGTISIGPICPVERNPPDPGCLPTAETYKAYPVYIRPLNGSVKTLITPALDGSFTMDLAPGRYYLTLEKQQNGIGSSNLPMEVNVDPGQETNLSIVIDTGIR